LPIASDSTDLVLASFVLSYVDDLNGCAFELARAVREDGDLFITDMHPETAAKLGWTRSFSASGRQHELEATQRSIFEIKAIFAAHGFLLVASHEPAFGVKEFELFTSRGKEETLQRSAGMPAIYLLHFQKQTSPRPGIEKDCALRLSGAYCAIGPNEILRSDITVRGNTIESIDSLDLTREPTNTSEIDLGGYIIFPGLVNSHDHLEFALFPKLGDPPYQNAVEWALDIQESKASTIALHKQVPKECSLWWGALRNLLCGVTTVCHHNPLDPVFLHEEFPVRVVSQYGWEHSVAFAKDISFALQHTNADEPFIIHACEGVDRSAALDLKTLNELGAIELRSVLIHGLALGDRGIALLNERQASLIVCPSSNMFLFGITHTHKQLRSIQRLGLGSDSPLTAAGDLLDEVRFVRSQCNLLPEEIYVLVTDRPANILRLQKGEGTLRPKAVADLIAVRHRNNSPSETLSSLSWRDVELVIIRGRVQLASTEMLERLPSQAKQRLSPLTVDGTVRWLATPVSELYDAAAKVLGDVRVGGLSVSPAEV
jgi:cytosine/adenosine deaminase-related metal-dependent hydrolase